MKDRAQPIGWRAYAKNTTSKCEYCGGPGPLTWDHVKPRSRGGPSNYLNQVLACKPCNSKKGDFLLTELPVGWSSMTAKEIVRWIEKNNSAAYDRYMDRMRSKPKKGRTDFTYEGEIFGFESGD